MHSSQLPPVFRFAPSPNGRLHVGHAYSALLNKKMARETGGKLLLRIEDVDQQRSRPEYEAGIYEDLEWLDIAFDETPRRQSDNLAHYQTALDDLIARGLAYPSSISRSEIAALAANDPYWPKDPDGAFLSPVSERSSNTANRQSAIRLNMEAALAVCSPSINWREAGERIKCDAGQWGDVVLKSRDGSFAYHLAVVVDDAAQNITNIVRGRDLLAATSIHRVLQTLWSLPGPEYLHHTLILDQSGEKLAKSRRSPTLETLRNQGLKPSELRKQLGFSA